MKIVFHVDKALVSWVVYTMDHEESSQGPVKFVILPGFTLVYTKERNVKETMEFKVPPPQKKHLRPTLSIDMIRILKILTHSFLVHDHSSWSTSCLNLVRVPKAL